MYEIKTRGVCHSIGGVLCLIAIRCAHICDFVRNGVRAPERVGANIVPGTSSIPLLDPEDGPRA